MLTFGRGFLHLAIVHILRSDTPGASVACSFHKSSTGGLGPFHESHEIEVDALVTDTIDQGRVVEYQGGIIVGQGDIVASDSCHVGTDRQPQEVVGRGAFLGGDSRR